MLLIAVMKDRNFMTRRFLLFSEKALIGMIKIAAIAFTEKGYEVAFRIKSNININEFYCDIFLPKKKSDFYNTYKIGNEYIKWVGEIFYQYDIIIFVCACGIAVRGIAPYVKDKFTDPAVIVIDETGSFLIPILSGHIGGANKYACILAEFTGGQAVITTSTDINNKFAVDIFAKKNNLMICNKECLKHISSYVLSGENIGFFCDGNVKGKIPEYIIENARAGFVISIYKKRLFDETLNLVPKKISLGIGCRKNTPAEDIEFAVKKTFEDKGIFFEAIKNAGTIDIKQNEKGMLKFFNKFNIPVEFFSAFDLEKACGEFKSSKFVKDITGVDNVCERAAALLCPTGEKVIEKTTLGSVTVAAWYDNDWSVNFG